MRDLGKAMNYYKKVSNDDHFNKFDKEIASQQIDRLKLSKKQHSVEQQDADGQSKMEQEVK